MQFTSTRNRELTVSFSKAVRDCIPSDGGVFIPAIIEDLRRWIYFIDENTSFSSIAGSLTSALINDEFSPIICEKIATDAFPFSPVVRQLDENLFMMELYHGYTGYHRDYGVSYLCSYLETTLQLNGGNVVLLDFTRGGLGPLMAKVLKGKKHIKSVLVYKKGTVHGLKDEDYVWNGGNIYPVEMEGTEAQIKAAISSIFADKKFVQEHNLTVANTTNVCRLLGQIFQFPYSFAQIKNKIDGDIYYAMDDGNFGTLMAGLYSWRFALPVSGFFVPGKDINFNKQEVIDPTAPANLERLESFFDVNGLMMRNFVFPVEVSDKQREKAAKELYMNYGVFADESTATAYATVKEAGDDVFDDGGSVILTAYKHPSLSSEYCRYVTGETPQMPDNIRASLKPVELGKPVVSGVTELTEIIKSLKA